MNLILRRAQLMSSITLPKPTIVLTETSSPLNGESYQEGETITINISVTGNSEYDLYNGIIRTNGANSQSWHLGTIVGDEYVLAANEVNVFTWSHTVTAADTNTQLLNFYVYGVGEVMLGEMTDVHFGSNTLSITVCHHDYAQDYLTFEALENGTFTLKVPTNVDSTYMTSVSYSTNNGETWVDTTIDNTGQTITTPTVNAGGKVLWKGVGKRMAQNVVNYSSFSATGNYIVNGNVMSLLYGDEFANQVTFPSGSTYNFCCLFRNNKKLISSENLILPATTLASNCYNSMFSVCTSLTTAPELPATTLADYCYYYMFDGCTSLTTAPSILPATTLANYCYQAMFYGCTSLTIAPELPATTLAINCYQSMFRDCTGLTTAPVLPATTLASSCYSQMFRNCTALTTAPVLPATTLVRNCYEYMFNGCTSLTTAPVLPATTLASSCYSQMFRNCTALTTAPVLPATTLVRNCYQSMFQNCSSLNYIKAMFTTTPSTTYTNNWVNGVAATGTFVKNSAATWNVTGTYGVPSGWTVQTA